MMKENNETLDYLLKIKKLEDFDAYFIKRKKQLTLASKFADLKEQHSKIKFTILYLYYCYSNS